MLPVTLAQMDPTQLFEAGMLVCFGTSWPVAILKTLRTRRVTGKSLGFLVLVFVGYLSGIAAKVSFATLHQQPLAWVTVLYALNALMVGTEILLYLRFRHADAPTPAPAPETVRAK